MPKTTSKTTTTTETFDADGNLASRVTETREETVESEDAPRLHPTYPDPTLPYRWPTVTSGVYTVPDQCTCKDKSPVYCPKHTIVVNDNYFKPGPTYTVHVNNTSDPVTVAEQVRANVKQMGV